MRAVIAGFTAIVSDNSIIKVNRDACHEPDNESPYIFEDAIYIDSFVCVSKESTLVHVEN